MKPDNKEKKHTKAHSKSKRKKTVKEQILQGERLRDTFVILAAIGAVILAVVTYYHVETLLIWITFGTGCLLLFALHLRWKAPTVTRLCVGLVLVGAVACAIVQYKIFNGRGEIRRDQPAGLTERPELLFEPQVEPFVPGTPITVRWTYRNIGKVTAFHVNICTSGHLVPNTFQGPLRYQKAQPEASQTVVDAVPVKPYYVTFSSFAPEPMTEEQIDAVTSGAYFLFWLGRGRYEDEHGTKYPIRVCFMYDPDPRDSPHMSVCPMRYLPREDDPNRECLPN